MLGRPGDDGAYYITQLSRAEVKESDSLGKETIRSKTTACLWSGSIATAETNVLVFRGDAFIPWLSLVFHVSARRRTIF